MPGRLSSPGVDVEEVPGGVRTITGAATSITGFVGRAPRGRTDVPVSVTSFGEYSRLFGGLGKDSRLGFAVRDFFLNGGSQAVIVRLFLADTGGGASPARAVLTVDPLEDSKVQSFVPSGAVAGTARTDSQRHAGR